jgi:hypothetical protein
MSLYGYSIVSLEEVKLLDLCEKWSVPPAVHSAVLSVVEKQSQVFNAQRLESTLIFSVSMAYDPSPLINPFAVLNGRIFPGSLP